MFDDFIDFPVLLMLLSLIIIIVLFWGIPNVMDMCVDENATWEFHNSVVQDKYIVEKTGFPFGSTNYFIKIDNHTIKIDNHNLYWSIIPNHTWLGYWVNKNTGELTVTRHI